MKIVEIRNATAPIRSKIANAYIDFSKMTASVVAIVTDVVRDGQPVIGYGFNSNGRYGAKGLLAERFIPRLLEAAPDDYNGEHGLDPHKAWNLMFTNEKPGGHGERSVAIGVLDMAMWDAAAKIAGVPLWRLLADRYRDGEVDSRIFVYAAGGYYQPGKGLEALQDEMRRYLDRGYSVVKMKVGGTPLDDDISRIEAVLDVLGGDGSRLAVDANGRFNLDQAINFGETIAPYGLRWYEEPGDPLDYALQATLADHYSGPMATGENLFSHQDARNLLRHGGMRPDRDILQFDCALSYGLVEYLRTLALLPDHGFGPRNVIPHGGHQMSLNIAAGLGLGGNESYPDVFHPFGGFADGIVVEDSRVGLPDAPGIGFEARAALIALMREVTET
ncbi:MAG: mandelate racemase/muconate lactonizing enzyme family protein [Alphaproteobacteria bacterium]|jgi:D(-)-tartrate dehydratase|nr:mandelate racemase/muconate lactonizing enzyme family protein [Rhodospirillaceae bacterium]MDG2479917.1 mandelate racemase/muconate lactonizing enzyme family protein [Alphaproteobacteria bacterium]MBT6204394.1 mandelate racemase/muconate lactonizing enzyme family protein [Rhodospirillaceae bacterium]MBT6510680.1 mandelate racemase/muconate lactonizing enzyme family protein [Rhodospirillaceae bacterium]MBT7614957.1 mandelate racemase/muconate lactonizing enzyme family protein [Rhodospirillace